MLWFLQRIYTIFNLLHHTPSSLPASSCLLLLQERVKELSGRTLAQLLHPIRLLLLRSRCTILRYKSKLCFLR